MLTAAITLVAAISLSSVTARPAERVAEPVSLATLLAGARYVWNQPLLLAGLTLDMFAVLFGGATALLPIFAKDVLRIDSLGFGLLRAAPSMGAIGMGFALAHMPLRRAGQTLLYAVAGFGVATIAFGLSFNPYLSFVLLALIGALDNISVVVRGTLVQRLTPDAMRGRVSAINSMFIVASNELGAFESGITAKGFELLWWGDAPVAFGAIASVVVGGIGTLLVVGLANRHWPQIRNLGSLSDVTPDEPTTVPQ